jgi:hypothetical protein
LAANRDFPDPASGRIVVGWNPGVESDGTLLVGRVTDSTGHCLATLVNYACHGTILAWDNTAISPDYVGALRELVETQTEAPCLFLQGAAGELAPRHQYVGDVAVADQAGHCVGHAVLSTLASLPPPQQAFAYAGVVESGAPLGIWKLRPAAPLPRELTTRAIEISLPIKRDFPSQQQLTTSLAAAESNFERERLQRRLLLRRSLGDEPTYRSQHVLWRLGDVLLVSVPNEAYSVLQTSLRREAAPRPLLVVTLANGGRGYLPPREDYAKATYSSTQSPFEPGCLEATIEGLGQEIQRIGREG